VETIVELADNIVTAAAADVCLIADCAFSPVGARPVAPDLQLGAAMAFSYLMTDTLTA
jgi:hypothetical protein